MYFENLHETETKDTSAFGYYPLWEVERNSIWTLFYLLDAGI